MLHFKCPHLSGPIFLHFILCLFIPAPTAHRINSFVCMWLLIQLNVLVKRFTTLKVLGIILEETEAVEGDNEEEFPNICQLRIWEWVWRAGPACQQPATGEIRMSIKVKLNGLLSHPRMVANILRMPGPTLMVVIHIWDIESILIPSRKFRKIHHLQEIHIQNTEQNSAPHVLYMLAWYIYTCCVGRKNCVLSVREN